jgi:hypothetical protein
VVSRTLRTNLVSLVLVYYDLLIVIAQVYSCIKFDLSIGVNPSD